MKKFRIGVIGLGKIAQDQHLPVIADWLTSPPPSPASGD
jgi:predicted dehydrogenase